MRTLARGDRAPTRRGEGGRGRSRTPSSPHPPFPHQPTMSTPFASPFGRLLACLLVLLFLFNTVCLGIVSYLIHGARESPRRLASRALERLAADAGFPRVPSICRGRLVRPVDLDDHLFCIHDALCGRALVGLPLRRLPPLAGAARLTPSSCPPPQPRRPLLRAALVPLPDALGPAHVRLRVRLLARRCHRLGRRADPAVRLPRVLHRRQVLVHHVCVLSALALLETPPVRRH